MATFLAPVLYYYERCRQPPWPWNIELAGGRDSHLLHWFLAGTIAGIGDLEIGDILPQLLRTCEDTHPSQQSRPRAHQVRARERVKTTLLMDVVLSPVDGRTGAPEDT